MRIFRSSLLALALAGPAAHAAPAVTPGPSPVSLIAEALKKPDAVPFAFKYDGKDASTILAGWKRTEKNAVVAGKRVHQIDYQDPTTGLVVTVEMRAITGFPAVDWVMYFTNKGTKDTPIIEDIQPLHATIACDTPDAVLHSSAGSAQSNQDFHLTETPITPGNPLTFGIGSGRSSDALNSINGNIGAFPFFNIQMGDHGLLGAIGWTGGWVMHVNRAADGKSIALDAGMVKTHLLLHPGETIRTPRIVLMDWQHGDFISAQNTWRKLMLAEYSPKDPEGRVVKVPICWNSWGTERASLKIAVAKALKKEKIPADVYWMDAGWYEPITLPPGVDTAGNSDWSGHRGNWVPSKDLFPNGMGPVGDALKDAGIGYLVWFESETASADAPWVHDHPDWYLKPGNHAVDNDNPYFLNLGNPEAFKAISDQISKFITDGKLTWYRQDFNFSPAAYWAAADTPDRVGMSEIKSITGLYAFWDKLRADHPGLQIDNCSSGGRRLDIETFSRSVSLWRSDSVGDPSGEQFHTQGLAPWAPLNAGVWIVLKGGSPLGSAQLLYEQRSGYSAGETVCVNYDPAPWLKTSFAEFQEVQPYFYGDFYPLLDQTIEHTNWSAWQLDRPDLNSGIILCLRRPNSIYSTLRVNLHGIVPTATYEVEVRTTMDKGAVQTMSGQELTNLQVAVPDKPGSTLVFYRKK